MITKVLSTVSPAPSRKEPSVFSDVADAFLSDLPTLQTDINELVVEINEESASITDQIAVNEITIQTALSNTSAEVIGLMADMWVAGPYVQGDVVWSPLTSINYRAKASFTSSVDPSVDLTNWVALRDKLIHNESRSSNTVLSLGDRGKIIEFSGSFTQTFSTAASLGQGWWTILKNHGTGAITLDPNGSETIDGLTSFVMYSSETRLIQCDGTTLNSIILSSFIKTFTSSGTFVKPPGYLYFSGLVWGAGASGTKYTTATAKPGGCGGGCAPFHLPSSAFGVTETISIGAGGAARTTNGLGVAGGSSSIGSLFEVFGGTNVHGGSVLENAYNTATTIPAVGFEGGNYTGINALALSSIWGGSAAPSGGGWDSGNSIYGGAAGGSITSADAVFDPGTSVEGGDGGAASVESNGTDGASPGGGGGASKNGNSGAGGNGQITMWGVI